MLPVAYPFSSTPGMDPELFRIDPRAFVLQSGGPLLRWSTFARVVLPVAKVPVMRPSLMR